MPAVSDKYKKEKKALILKNAFECFAEKGFQAATIDDIVTRSGISKGAIYNYFNSKDEIYIELMNQQTEENMGRLKSNLSSLSSSKEKMDYLFETYSNLNYHPHFQNLTRVHIEFWIYSSRKEDLSELMISRYQMYKSIFKEIVEEGIQKGEFPSDANAEELALVFWGFIDGASIHFLMLGNEHYPYQNVFKTIKKLIYSNLAIK